MTPESSAPTQPGSSAREPETEAERSRLDVLWDEMWVACLGRWHRGRPVWEIRADIETEAREEGRREGLAAEDLAAKTVDGSALFIRGYFMGIEAAARSEGAASRDAEPWTAEQHREDAKLVQSAMQRLAQARTYGQVYVPAEDASNLLMAMHRDGIYRPRPAASRDAEVRALREALVSAADSAHQGWQAAHEAAGLKPNREPWGGHPGIFKDCPAPVCAERRAALAAGPAPVPVGPVRIRSANCAAGDHDECAAMVEQDVPELGITDCLCQCHDGPAPVPAAGLDVEP